MRSDLELALRLADVADTISLPRYRTGLAVETKADLTPVTEADRDVERTLRARLARERPGDAVLGEEEGLRGHGDRRWILDPIDGTRNYSRGIPVWATLLALEEKGAVRLGVVSAPALGRRWWAERGTGAFADGERISVSTVARVEDAVLSFSIENALPELARRAWHPRGLGDFWAHMLVAEGAVDGAVDAIGVSEWDLAAVQVIVEEAGGRFSDLQGRARTDSGTAITRTASCTRSSWPRIGAEQRCGESALGAGTSHDAVARDQAYPERVRFRFREVSVSSYQVSSSYRAARQPEPGGGVAFKILALFLGIAVAVLAIVAVVLVRTADDARDEARAAAVTTDHSNHAATDDSAVSLPLQSFAGTTAENAEELAMARTATSAELPPVPAGDVVKVHMTLKDMVVEIAPGVRYNTWAFDGHGAPGPILHVREGQTVEMTLTNGGAIPHSIDFHAARIAPDFAFKDVAPGEAFTFKFKAGDPGVYMYHCGTKPVLAHIANGMYGAIVVDPAKPLPKADKEYVLVASEWYLNGDGISEPASLDMAKARAMQPDWTTFNGYANQYVTHPLTADPGETVRFHVVAAGPTLDTNFHVVGTIFDRAWVNGDMTQFQRGVQTVGVPAGGGAVFDVKIDEPGSYPFVSHAFAHVDLGQVGLLKVGNPRGGSSH